MVSYWERRLQDNRKRSLQAQADRYSAQVPGAVREAQERLRVEKAQRQQAQARAAQAQRGREQEQSRQAGLSEQRAQAEARVAQSQRDREIRELEAAQRAQAEARANFAQAQRDAEASAQAERISPTRSLSGETVAPPSDPLEFYKQRVAKQENQAAMRDFWEYVAYGPERRSVLGGEAGKVERFLRDWGISEQEAREGVERLGEGRVLSGAGYLTAAAAGIGVNVGDLRRFALRAARGSRFLPGAADAAADVARATPRARPTGFPEAPSPESIARIRAQESDRLAQERARRQIIESNEFRRAQEIAKRELLIRTAGDARIRNTPIGPRPVGPSGVEALRPLRLDPWRTNPVEAAAASLASRGTIRPTLAGNMSRIISEAATDAFRNSGVPQETIDAAIRNALARNSRIFYEPGTPYNPNLGRQPGGYGSGLAGQVNNLYILDILEDVGRQIGVSPAPGHQVMPWGQMAADFENLLPSMSITMEGLNAAASSGRFRSGVEMGRSKSLGLMSPWQRLNQVEAPRFGINQAYDSSPIYGFASRRPGTSPMPWESRVRSGARGGDFVTSPRAAEAYGPITATFGPRVRNETSFVFGDSLLQGRLADGLSGGVGRPLSGTTAADVALAGGQTARTAPYIETQMWGNLTLNDIQSIAARDEYRAGIMELLKRLNLDIPFIAR